MSEAFTAALEANASALLAYFERRVHVREDAADLLSETLVTAWRRLDGAPEEPERVRMWLFTIAAHTLANQHRTVRRRSRLASKIAAQLALPPRNEPDHADVLSIREAVLNLDLAYRELVMLIHWDGLTIAEAAEVMGLNPSTARSRYAVARESLRSQLSELRTLA